MSLRLEIDKELERKFREWSMRKFGYSKGSLKKASEFAIAKAISEDTKKQERETKDTITKALKLLHEGINIGGLKYKHRDELHERH